MSHIVVTEYSEGSLEDSSAQEVSQECQTHTGSPKYQGQHLHSAIKLLIYCINW